MTTPERPTLRLADQVIRRAGHLLTALTITTTSGVAIAFLVAIYIRVAYSLAGVPDLAPAWTETRRWPAAALDHPDTIARWAITIATMSLALSLLVDLAALAGRQLTGPTRKDRPMTKRVHVTWTTTEVLAWSATIEIPDDAVPDEHFHGNSPDLIAYEDRHNDATLEQFTRQVYDLAVIPDHPPTEN